MNDTISSPSETIWKLLADAIRMLLLLTLVTGCAYPLLVTAVAQLCFSTAANGSMTIKSGSTVYCDKVGQQFTQPKYFWGRLSATAPTPYNGAASGGSNFGPLHAGLVSAAKDRISQLKTHDPTINSVPVDLVTASASGLDPHISLPSALLQVKRVAQARKMTEVEVRDWVYKCLEPPQFGILGEERVHVLRLNAALDRGSQTLQE